MTYHVIFTTILWNTNCLISQVRTELWLSSLPHFTESLSNVISMQTRAQTFASNSYVFPPCLIATQDSGGPTPSLTSFLESFPTCPLSFPCILPESLSSSAQLGSPLPPAMEASSSYIPPIQPLCLWRIRCPLVLGTENWTYSCTRLLSLLKLIIIPFLQ